MYHSLLRISLKPRIFRVDHCMRPDLRVESPRSNSTPAMLATPAVVKSAIAVALDTNAVPLSPSCGSAATPSFSTTPERIPRDELHVSDEITDTSTNMTRGGSDRTTRAYHIQQLISACSTIDNNEASELSHGQERYLRATFRLCHPDWSRHHFGRWTRARFGCDAAAFQALPR